MRAVLIFPLLFLFEISFSQTGIYSSDGILTVEMPTSIDILNGYPDANDLDSNAISEYNKGTEIVLVCINLKKRSTINSWK